MTFFKTPCYKGPHYDTPLFGGVDVRIGGAGGVWPIPKVKARVHEGFMQQRDPDEAQKRRRAADEVAMHDAAVLAVLANELTDD